MKTLKRLFFAAYCMVVLYACTQDDAVGPSVDSASDLVGAIQSAEKQAISFSELPTSAQAVVTQDHTDKYVENAKQAIGLGYEVNMRAASGVDVGESSQLYFDNTGREVEDRRKGKKNRARRQCFDIAFPHSFTMPDGSEITLSAKEDFQLIKDWYEANPDTEGKPELVFPVTVTYGDITEEIANKEALDAILEECKNDLRDRIAEKREEKKEERKCFALAFPHTLTLPDGSSVTINSEEDKTQVREWYAANPDVKEKPALNFPVTIVYQDGTETAISSEEELKEASKECREEKRCFTLAFPHAVTLPDGSTITINSDEDKTSVREWYAANPGTREKPALVFPITIVYQDGSEATVNSEEELKAAKEACVETAN